MLGPVLKPGQMPIIVPESSNAAKMLSETIDLSK